MKKIISFFWFGFFAALAVGLSALVGAEQSILILLIAAFIFGGVTGCCYGYKILDLPADVNKWQILKLGLLGSIIGFLLGVIIFASFLGVLITITSKQPFLITEFLSGMLYINLFGLYISSITFGWLAIIFGVVACYLLFYINKWMKRT